MIEPLIEKAFSEYGLLVALLLVGNVIQWRTNQKLTELFIKMTEKNSVILERLTQRIEDLKK